MLFAGRNWHPSKIQRVIEMYPSSTRVVKVATDDGIGFLKGLGNPAGPVSLVTELVAGELAAWFGLPIPDFSMIFVDGLRIPMQDRGHMLPGKGFISREVFAITFDCSNIYLNNVINRDDISKLVVFDTWIRNIDRCPPDEMGYPQNVDNILFTQAGKNLCLTVIDHSHCFTESSLEEAIDSQSLLHDTMIYGLFPEFRPFLNESAVRRGVARLREVDMGFLEEVVGSVPPEWGLTNHYKKAFARQIYQRAMIVADYLPQRLINEPRLEFGG